MKFGPILIQCLIQCLIDWLEMVIWKPEQGYTTFTHEGKANIKL